MPLFCVLARPAFHSIFFSAALQLSEGEVALPALPEMPLKAAALCLVAATAPQMAPAAAP